MQRKRINIFRRLFQGIGIIFGFSGIFCITAKKFTYPGLQCDFCPISNFGCPMGMTQRALAGTGLIPGVQSAASALWLMLGSIFAYAISLGRAWCGWICPFGTLNDALGSIGRGNNVQRITAMKLALVPVILFPFFFVIANMQWNADISFTENLFGEGRSAYSISTLIIAIVAAVFALWLYKKRALTGFKYIVLLITVALAWAFNDAFFCHVCPANTTEAALPQLASSGSFLMLKDYTFVAVLALMLIGMLLVQRFWCRYLCPFGAMLGIFNRVSLLQLRHNADDCKPCKAECTKYCTMGMVVVVGKKGLNKESAGDCTRCGECVRNCPNGALSFGAIWSKDKSTKKD